MAKKTKKAVPAPETCITMVLDRSGSMHNCRDATIKSVNSYLAEAKGDDNLKSANFSLLIFDSGSIDAIRSGAISDIEPIAARDFVPRGGTPLYDAIGRGVVSVDEQLAKAGAKKGILVIVTDGFENASRKYNYEAIKELIEARQAAGWLIVFLGAGLEAAKQGAALGIRAGTIASIAMNEQALGSTASAVYDMNAGYAATQSFDDARMFATNAEFSTTARRAMASNGETLVAKHRPGGHAPRKPKENTAKAGEDTISSLDAWK